MSRTKWIDDKIIKRLINIRTKGIPNLKVIFVFIFFVFFTSCNISPKSDSLILDSSQNQLLSAKEIESMCSIEVIPVDSIRVRKNKLFQWIVDSLRIKLKNKSIPNRCSATGIGKKNKYLFKPTVKGHYGEYFLGNNKDDIGYLIVYYPNATKKWEFDNNEEIFIYYSTIGIKQQQLLYNIGLDMNLELLKKTIGKPDDFQNKIAFYKDENNKIVIRFHVNEKLIDDYDIVKYSDVDTLENINKYFHNLLHEFF